MAEKEGVKKKKKKKTADSGTSGTSGHLCTMTMHHEISARGSLMPAGDGSRYSV